MTEVASSNEEGFEVVCAQINQKPNAEGNEMICNTPRGIVRRIVEPSGDVEEEIVLSIYLRNVTIFRDPIIGSEYMRASVYNAYNSELIDVYDAVRVTKFTRYANKRHLVRESYKRVWQNVLNVFPHKTDIVISGFVCPPPRYGLPCKVRDYFNAGILSSVEKHEAKQAFEAFYSVLSDFAPNDVWIKQVMAAYVYGAFVNFMLTRKLWGLPAWFTIFEGPANTGKTTVARMLVATFYPRFERPSMLHGVIQPPTVMLKPQLIGRSQEDVVTGLIIFDDVSAYMLRRRHVTAALEAFINSLRAWIAGDEVFPAYGGAIITTSDPAVKQIGIMKNSIVVEITEPINISGKESYEFNKNMPWNELVKFGSYHLLYAERNWDDVKDVVLGQRETAPYEYFKRVLEDLGLNMPELLPIAVGK